MTLRERLRRHTRGDASGLITTYTVLLFALPAQLVVGPLGASGTPAGIVGIGLVLYWLFMRLVPDSGVARGVQPIRLVVGFFGASILVAYAFGVIRPLPPEQLSGADRGILSMLSWVGVAIATADMLSTREKVDKLIKVIVVLAGVVALMGLLQFAAGVNLADFYKIPGLKINYDVAVVSERSDFRRVAATASHPIEFGMVLAMVLPIALHTAFYAKTRRFFWWGIVLLLGLTSPMSLSRSAILGLSIALIVLLAGWPTGRRLAVLLVLPVFVVGLRLVIPGLVGTIKSLFTGLSSDPSIQGRTDDYAVVGKFIDQSPLVGRGFGTFLPKDFITLDNQYLGSIIETGYIGLSALICLFLVGFFTARGIRVRSFDEPTRDLAQSLAASIAVAAFGYVTFDGLGFPMVTGLLFLLLGVIGALWRLVREDLASGEAISSDLHWPTTLRSVPELQSQDGDRLSSEPAEARGVLVRDAAEDLEERTIAVATPDEETVVVRRPEVPVGSDQLGEETVVVRRSEVPVGADQLGEETVVVPRPEVPDQLDEETVVVRRPEVPDQLDEETVVVRRPEVPVGADQLDGETVVVPSPDMWVRGVRQLDEETVVVPSPDMWVRGVRQLDEETVVVPRPEVPAVGSLHLDEETVVLARWDGQKLDTVYRRRPCDDSRDQRDGC